MSSKPNNPKNSEQGEVDKSQKNKTSNAIDESQITMNFGQDQETTRISDEEFKEMAEAEMKKRAQEGQRLRHEMQAQKSLEQAQQEKNETEVKKKAVEEQRLQKEAKAQREAAHELRLKEKAQAQEKAEQDQQIFMEEAMAKQKIEEKNRINEAEIGMKSRDEEWKKFKEEADSRGNPETADRREYIHETDERFEETAHPKKTSPKAKVLLLLLIAALAVAVIWIFSVFNKDSDKAIPVFPKNEAVDVEDASVTPETNDFERQTNIEDAGVTPESAPDTESQTVIENASVAPEPGKGNAEASSSNLEVGSTLGKGIIFKIDSSGKTGTLAYAKDLEPMTWENAMNINEQLGEGWRLPTLEELSEMYATIGPGSTNSGGFTEELYWSDQAYDKNQARLVRFSDGNTSFHYNKSVEHRKFKVRAVKDFSR